MKKLTIVCLLLATFHVRADMVIVQKVEGMRMSGEMTMKIKGDKIRTDASPQISTIMDTASGDMITLMHAQKSYMKISAGKTKALMEQMKALQGQANPGASPAAPLKFVDTGKREKVNGYDAGIFTAETPTTKFTFWVTRDFPNFAAVQEQMKKLQTAMQNTLGAAATDSIPNTSELPGLPVKTEMENGGQKITTSLLSAKEGPVSDADLAIPADYKEMQMPSFNMPPGGAPKP